MALATELSGVQAAQTYIDTVGNNVANANTTGFKLSNPDFGDLYASAQATPGEGVATTNLAQSFAQGQITQTGNPYNVAIDGNGFFQLQTGSGIVYSRDGAFQLNKDGNLAMPNGAVLLGFPPTASGNGSLQPIQIGATTLPGTATTDLGLNINLPTTDAAIDTGAHPFKVGDSSSYNESTSTSVYDSLGASNMLTTYYTVVSGSGSSLQWQTHWGLSSSNGTLIASGSGPTLSFDNSGQLSSGSGKVSVTTLPDGAAPLDFTLDYTGSTVSNLAFAVNAVKNDGMGSGQFSGATISQNGQVTAQFGNGTTRLLGTIALASFANPQGLVPMNGNVWASSPESGDAISGAPGTGSLGQLQSGAVEGSNVDLTTQLVDLIVAQQAYQANTQGINIEQQDFQKLMTIQ